MFLLLKLSLLIVFVLQTETIARPTNILLEDLKADKRIDPEIFKELQLKRSSKLDALVVLSLDDTRSGPRKQKIAEITKLILQYISNISKDYIQVNQTYESIRAIAVSVTVDGIRKLLRHPNVLRIGLDAIMKIDEGDEHPLREKRSEKRLEDMAGIPGIIDKNMPELYASYFDRTHGEGLTGKGINIAIYEGGVNTLLDFKLGRAIFTSEHCFGTKNKPCPNGEYEQSGPGVGIGEYNSHGTEVTSLALMAAPDASITVLKNSGGNSSMFLRALDYVANHLPEVRVINMSAAISTENFGENCHTANAFGLLAFEILENLENQGVVTVATTGNNSGTDGSEMPGCLNNIISVSAYGNFVNEATVEDVLGLGKIPGIASFATFGRFIDIVAPGDSLNVLLPDGSNTGLNDGTSYAAPIVAGCVANLLQKFPEATPAQIRNALRKGSNPSITGKDAGYTLPYLTCGKALDHLESYARYNSHEGGAPNTTQGICSRPPKIRNAILSTIYERIPIELRNLKNQIVQFPSDPTQTVIVHSYSDIRSNHLFPVPHRLTTYGVAMHSNPISASFGIVDYKFIFTITRDYFGSHLLAGTITDRKTSSNWSFTFNIIDEHAPYIKTRNHSSKLGESLSYQLDDQAIHTMTGFYDIQVTSPQSASFDHHSRTFSIPPFETPGQYLVKGTIDDGLQTGTWSFIVNINTPMNCAYVTADQLASVKVLSLAERDLVTLHDGYLAGLTGLKVLDLSRNQLSTLPDDLFSDLTSLETLSLWDNNITSLSAEIFDSTTKLKWLSVRDNSLTDFPQVVSDDLSMISKLYLGGNSFSDEVKQRLITNFGNKVKFTVDSDTSLSQAIRPRIQIELVETTVTTTFSEDSGKETYTIKAAVKDATLPLPGEYGGFGLGLSLSLEGSAVEGTDYELEGSLPILNAESENEEGIAIIPTQDFLNNEGTETIIVQGALRDGINIEVLPLEIELHDTTNSATALPVPGKPHLASNGSDLTLTWTAPQIADTQNAINDYDIEYRISGGEDPFTRAGYDGTATTYTLSNLRPEMPYEARIRAKNPDGAGAWSAVGSGSSQRVGFSTLSNYPVITTSGDEKGTIKLLPNDAANAASVQFMPRVHKIFSINFNYNACYDESRSLREVKNEDYYRKGIVLMVGKPIETYLAEGSLRPGYLAGLSPDIQRRGLAVSLLNYKGLHVSVVKDGHGKALRGHVAYSDGLPSANCEVSVSVSVNSSGLMSVVRSRGSHSRTFSYQMTQERFDSLEGTNIAFSTGTGDYASTHSVKITNMSGFLGQNGNSHDKWWELW